MGQRASRFGPSLEESERQTSGGAGPARRRPIDLPREVSLPAATRHAINLISTENPVLKLIATERPLPQILDAVVHSIESRCDGATASVLLMSDDGRHLLHGSAPGLPDGYVAAVDGLRIGPSVGSCGTAAHLGERVIVSDTANDPLWADFTELVEKYQLRACWSQPIVSADGEVLGTFAMYYTAPREPSPRELEYVEVATDLAGIAITRHRADRTKRAEERRRRERGAALVQLAKSESLAAGEPTDFVRQATEAAARLLPVQRVSLWLFNRNHSTLSCQDLFQLSIDRHSDGAELKAENYPRYFAALERGRAVVADNALTHSDTSEFAEGYLAPHGIASMLDAPIRGSDGLIGVVCCEHVGPARVWTANEQDFAASIADLAALAIEASKRRRAEQACRDSDRQLLQRRSSELTRVRSDFDRLFELSLDLMCVAGADGCFRQVNAAFETVLGYSERELVGQPFLGFVHPLDRRATGEELDKLSEDKPRAGFANRYLAKGGSYRWLEWSVVSIPHDDAMFVVARDLTDRRRAEERLRQLSNVVEQTDDAVFITDRDGTIEYVNRAFETTTLYSRQEALGKSPRILNSGKQDREYFERLWGTILRGETHRGEVVNRKKDGHLYYAEQTITPIKGPDGRINRFVSVVKDMTERRQSQRMELELELAARVQRRLYPLSAPQLEGFDVAGGVFFAKATCGDYFDFIDTGNRSLTLAVGDVCGHGFGPALLMAETRAYLRSLARIHADTREIFGTINESLAADLDDHHYVTLIMAVLDPSTSRLRWANAGHVPGYVLDRTGAVKTELTPGGFPLGMFHGTEYPACEEVVLEPGETVALLTDGLTELENRSGACFGSKAVLETLSAHRHEPAERMVANVREAAERFAGGKPQADDMTIVVCKRLPVA